jgi:Acetyltransferases
MIMLKKIAEDNFNECVKMEVEENQKSFVANNTYSLAQAWLYQENAEPFAIYNDEEMVGFVMLDTDYNGGAANGICDLWRLMIDKKHQKKGYGKAAMHAVISYAKEELHSEKMRTSVVQGNTGAENLYMGLGFVPNGEMDGDERVMILDLCSK